jgi:predicted phage terminase large subunit-like protein
MSEYLLACQKGEITRLIINVPPRHLKSISVAISFPAWLLGHNPSEQIMCASYAQGLSDNHSRNCRMVVEADWYKDIFPSTELSVDQNTKKKFTTTACGHRIATSVGGTVTGLGGNFLIVDDPLNAGAQMSEASRNEANNWFDQVYSTRLNDKKKGVIIVIMQRLHEDDLTGHLLKKGGWEHLCLPAVAEKDEVLERGTIRITRTVGQFLHEERMGRKEIEQEKIALGSYGFAGQYQQRPSPEGGGEFRKEWLCYYETIAVNTLNTYIIVDPANSKSKQSDYTAIIVVGAGGDGNLYVIDIIRDKLGVKQREDILFELHAKYKPKSVVYEKYGMQVDSDWIRRSMDDRNYRFHIEDVGGKLSKTDRILRLRNYFVDHKIWLPKTLYKANYQNKVIDVIEEFIIQEYLTFPVGVHDDMLDALSRICDINIQYPNKSNIDYYALYKYTVS